MNAQNICFAPENHIILFEQSFDSSKSGTESYWKFTESFVLQTLVEMVIAPNCATLCYIYTNSNIW